MCGASNASLKSPFSSSEIDPPFPWASDVQCIIAKVKDIVNGVAIFQMVMFVELVQSVDAVKLRHAKPWRVGALVDNDDVVRHSSVFRSEAFRQEEKPVFDLNLIQLFGVFYRMFHFVVV